MPLDSQCRSLLELIKQLGSPDLSAMEVAEARAMRERQKLPPGPPADVRDHRIPGPGGELALRDYRAPGAGGPLPGLVYFHGGGFVLGSIESHDALCRQLAIDSGCAIVSVEYRLAPEHKFPSAIDDACAAAKWVHAHAAELAIDPARLAIGGDSAGATLATAVARLSRQEGPPLVFQLLIYPVTDLRSFDTPSYIENAEGYYLTRSAMHWFRDHYLARVEDRDDPRASPLACTDLAGLPPAHIVTAEYDPLRDEAEAYARALQAAGVRCTLKRYDGAIHAFVSLYPYLDLGRSAVHELSAALRAGLAGEDKAVFRWELMKLLIQIVWADDEVAIEERRVLLGLADRLALSDEHKAIVRSCLDGGTKLPAPNMTILRARRDEVIQAAEQLVLADTEITEDENRVLAELNTLLGKA